MTATLRNTRSTAASIPRTDPISTEQFPGSGRLPSSSREANRIPYHQKGFAYDMDNPPLPRVELPHRRMPHQSGLLCHNLPSKISLPRNMDLMRNTDLQRSHMSQCILKLPRHDLQYYQCSQSLESPCNIDLRSQTGFLCRQDTNCNKILPTRQEFTFDLDFPCDQKTTSCAVTASEESWTIKFQNLQRLLETQNEILRNQSRRLEQCEHQIESYETRTHSLRVCEDGGNYIQRAYLETFGKDDKGAITEEDNSIPNTGQDASEEVDDTTTVEKYTTPEVNESGEQFRQQEMSRPFISDSALVEVEELRKRLRRLVAVSDDYNCQLNHLSNQIAHYDDQVRCKRLQLEDLQQQLGKHDLLLMNTDGRKVDEYGCNPPLLSDPHQQQEVQKRHLDCNSAKFNRLFLTMVESDTGLSSLGSESSFDTSPADSRHKLDEIPLKYRGNF